jgi:hypothetical protein
VLLNSQDLPVDVDLDIHCIAISALWTLTTPVPWDDSLDLPVMVNMCVHHRTGTFTSCVALGTQLSKPRCQRNDSDSVYDSL